jgi:hypothetical protein
MNYEHIPVERVKAALRKHHKTRSGLTPLIAI